MPKRKKYVKKKPSTGGGGGSTTPPSSTPSSNSQTIDELKAVQQPIPTAPTLALAQQDPLYLERAGTMLDWSEGRGPKRARAHARSHHVGLSDGDLDARGKPVATSFKSKYDQDKAYATMYGTGQDNNAYNQATTNPRGAVYSDHDIWGKKEDAKGNKNKGGFRTAPLARVAEQQSDGSYEHFNAKVTGAFLKYSKDGTDARVQTLYPNQYQKLEKPDNPATMPQHVSLNDLHDTGKLRHVEPEVKDSSAKGRVIEAPPPSEQEALVEVAPDEEVALAPDEEIVELAPEEVVEATPAPKAASGSAQQPKGNNKKKPTVSKKQQQKRNNRKQRRRKR